MKRIIHLIDNDVVRLVLPDGRSVSVEYSNLEPGDQLPELDILLPCLMMANCFGDTLVPAPELPGFPHCRLTRQITIPIETGKGGDEP